VQPALFHRFRQLAYDKAGIALKEGKEALVAARVTKRVRALQLEGAAEYLRYLEAEDDGQELERFLDVISTHFTSFFREADHFRELEVAVRERMAQGQTRLRLWSAASSSGEEPWSMAMTVAAIPGTERLDWRILATDIAADTLAQAARGHYPADRVEPVPAALRDRFLVRLPDPAGADPDRYGVADELRRRVVFRQLNLVRPPFPMKGPLDVVFCRNVFIYFDAPTRQRVVEALEGLLRPGGLFVLGHTETLNGIRSGLRMVRPSVFRRPAGEVAR
jgi:chemotaxis protein methyltransferase CheR